VSVVVVWGGGAVMDEVIAASRQCQVGCTARATAVH
jgi:hypothetical protein